MFSYYEEEAGEEKTLFPFFEGDSYDEIKSLDRI